MTLHGYLNADEYGAAASFFGGMGLTMSIWGESLSEGTRSLFWSAPKYVALPRAMVSAALQETTRHPGLKMIPQLQRNIKLNQEIGSRFRSVNMDILLENTDLIGALHNEPDARALWVPIARAVETREAQLEAARKEVCSVQVFGSKACSDAAALVQRLESELAALRPSHEAWQEVLEQSRSVSALSLWHAIGRSSSDTFDPFLVDLSMLHNVSDIYDERLVHLTGLAYNISLSLTKEERNSWLQQVLNNLLRIQIWDTCLEFIQQREHRVRSLMITAGVNELTLVNDRVLNASLLTVSGATERATVQNWFAEMSSYAWWLPDDIVSLVRRCIAQEAGDCTRIGPTEITAISVQIGEQSKIVEDWVRRIFIGMWNAMPALAVLLAVELIVICMPKRGYVAGLPEYPRLEYSRPAYPQLEAPRKQLKALLPPSNDEEVEEIDEEPVTATRRRKLPTLMNSPYMIVRRPRLLKNI